MLIGAIDGIYRCMIIYVYTYGRLHFANLPYINPCCVFSKPQSYVSKYETGERKLDYVEIRDICKVLGISMQRFNQLYEKKIRP